MTEKKAQNPLVWVLVIVLVVVVAAAAVIFFNRQPQAPPTEDLTDGNVPMLGYAEGTTVTRDENALQDAVDKMAEKLEKGSMMLEYEGDAYSSDGENFTGYLANAAENSYDMYFDMYADSALKDEIFLSASRQGLGKVQNHPQAGKGRPHRLHGFYHSGGRPRHHSFSNYGDHDLAR